MTDRGRARGRRGRPCTAGAWPFRSAARGIAKSRSTTRDTSAGAAHVGRTPGGRLRSFHRRRRRAQERGTTINASRIGISLDGRSRGPRCHGRVPFRRRWTPALRDAPGRRGPGARPPRPRRDRSARSCVRTARGPCATAADDAASAWREPAALVVVRASRDIERRSKDDLALTSVSLVLR